MHAARSILAYPWHACVPWNAWPCDHKMDCIARMQRASLFAGAAPHRRFHLGHLLLGAHGPLNLSL
eukprot:364447-Chlamydomonas_euryale.AAC.25